MTAIFIGIGNFLAAIFGKSMSFFVHQYSGRVVFKAAQIALIVGMMGVLYAAVTSILGSIFMSLPDILSVPISWVAPPNINSLIVAYLSFRIALALYRWKHTQIKTLNYA